MVWPVGGRLAVVITDGGGGVHDHDGQAFGGEVERFLFGQEFGAFVVAGHVGERDGGGFIAEAALDEADAADGTRVDDAIHTGALSEAEEVAGACHIGVVHLLGTAHP